MTLVQQNHRHDCTNIMIPRQRNAYCPDIRRRQRQRQRRMSKPRRQATSLMMTTKQNDGDDDENGEASGKDRNVFDTIGQIIKEDKRRSVVFSLLMISCGATLGPFLDSYHSAFGVLQYDKPFSWMLWSSPSSPPALTTTWWVFLLFGLAGFIIGWLYIILDRIIISVDDEQLDPNESLVNPSPPKILVGISFFTLQYWLSGVLSQSGVDRTTMLNVMSVLAAAGFVALDGTMAGFYTSLATAIGGPLIEVGLITLTRIGMLGSTGGYHYTDPGETGFFPLWIVPVYFLGGPANGNLARGFWNFLTASSPATSEPLGMDASQKETNMNEPCPVCKDTRRVPCPNCDGVGKYAAMGGSSVTCTSCRGKGFVICRACFDRYDDLDPYDIEQIRQFMDRMPD